MKIKLNGKDIYKKKLYIVVEENKIKFRTYNINKIRSYDKTMKYIGLKNYKILKIEIERIDENDRY